MPISHNSIAMKLRLEKEADPSRFCPYRSCLYKTGGPLCPKHFARNRKSESELTEFLKNA